MEKNTIWKNLNTSKRRSTHCVFYSIKKYCYKKCLELEISIDSIVDLLLENADDFAINRHKMLGVIKSQTAAAEQVGEGTSG